MQSSQGHSPLPVLQRPGSCSPLDVRALPRRSHFLGQSKDPALLPLFWILTQSIQELVALRLFFSRTTSQFSSFFPKPFFPGDGHPSFYLLIARGSPTFQNLCSSKTRAILLGKAQSSLPSLTPLLSPIKTISCSDRGLTPCPIKRGRKLRELTSYKKFYLAGP